jgi:pyruvate kinase
MTKRTKIVATLGPASQSRGQVEALAREGVDVFRLNAAHGDKAWHDGATARVREVSDALGRPLAVLQDLAGPKLRLGELPGGAVSCQRGDRFRLRAAAAGGPGELPINEPSLIGDLRVGNDVLLADGTVALRIVATHRDHAEAEVTLPGEARSRQGISAPHTALRLPSLTPKDLRDLDDALARGVDYVGLSFVRTPADVELLRTEMTKRGGNAAIIAKIETARALDALDDIICAADGVMVARGDLGVELDVARVPMLQKRIINRSRSFGVPVITATQMLESMRTSGRPTRAEASDVANAILDGTDAVMLSAETASGNYPLEAARTMRRIIEETEHVQLGGGRPPGPSPGGRGENTSGLSSVLCSLSSVPEGITLAAVEAAGRLADRIEARLIVVATRGAHTALACARHRFRTPTLGLSDRPATLRRLALLWGVLPVRFDDPGSIPALIEKAAAYVVRAKLADRGDRLVYVLGQQWVDGAHNSILIHEIR